MKNIVCIGDSHTWGQGAGDFFNKTTPSLQPGDKRQISFDPPCYVNLLREYVHMMTGSHYGEITKDKHLMYETSGDNENTPFISVKGKGRRISAKITGYMFRAQMKCGPEGCKACILVDGAAVEDICTYDRDNNPNNYKVWNYYGFRDCEHEVVIENSGAGQIDLYRIDFYGGKYAVINSGIGSCDSGSYLKNYWSDMLQTYTPDLVILEGFSINDWINNTTLDKYMDNLKTMFYRIRALGGKCLLLTVSPIEGVQRFSPNSPEYVEYIDAGIKAAESENIPVADSFKMMSHIFPQKALMPQDIKKQYYEDNWHVNNNGHKIYFECLKQKLKECRFIRNDRG